MWDVGRDWGMLVLIMSKKLQAGFCGGAGNLFSSSTTDPKGWSARPPQWRSPLRDHPKGWLGGGGWGGSSVILLSWPPLFWRIRTLCSAQPGSSITFKLDWLPNSITNWPKDMCLSLNSDNVQSISKVATLKRHCRSNLSSTRECFYSFFVSLKIIL